MKFPVGLTKRGGLLTQQTLALCEKLRGLSGGSAGSEQELTNARHAAEALMTKTERHYEVHDVAERDAAAARRALVLCARYVRELLPRGERDKSSLGDMLKQGNEDGFVGAVETLCASMGGSLSRHVNALALLRKRVLATSIAEEKAVVARDASVKALELAFATQEGAIGRARAILKVHKIAISPKRIRPHHKLAVIGQPASPTPAVSPEPAAAEANKSVSPGQIVAA